MSGPRVFAVLVGIDHYYQLGLESQLKGAVADVSALEVILRERIAPSRLNLQILRDDRARRDDVLGAWEELIEKVDRPEDEVLLFWSGHGSRIRDEAGQAADERDGWDETLVPSDSGRRDEENRDIVDDEIRAFLHRLSEKTRNVSLLVDACHSGTAARMSVRTVPRDSRPRSQQATETPRGLPEGFVHLAACRDEQKALELPMEGPVRGVFTWTLEQALTELPDSFSWHDLFTLAQARVGVGTFGAQIPSIEGARHRRCVLSRGSYTKTFPSSQTEDEATK